MQSMCNANISEAFDKRLGRLPPDKPPRAIVMLRTGANRRSGASRAAKIREIRTGATSPIASMDGAWQHSHVRAIIEDQSIALAR